MQPQFTISGQVNFPAHVKSTGETEMIVAVFYPHTISMFIGVPPSVFYNQEISGYDIANPALNELAGKIFECTDSQTAIILLERWLLTKIRNSDNIMRIGAAVSSILGNPSAPVRSCSSLICLGNKQFGRLFREYVGMKPKEYARIARFQKAMKMMQLGSRDYAGIAYSNGYSDQSHFIRDFRLFSGFTPERLMQYQTPYSDLYTDPA